MEYCLFGDLADQQRRIVNCGKVDQKNWIEVETGRIIKADAWGSNETPVDKSIAELAYQELQQEELSAKRKEREGRIRSGSHKSDGNDEEEKENNY